MVAPAQHLRVVSLHVPPTATQHVPLDWQIWPLAVQSTQMMCLPQVVFSVPETEHRLLLSQQHPGQLSVGEQTHLPC